MYRGFLGFGAVETISKFVIGFQKQANAQPAGSRSSHCQEPQAPQATGSRGHSDVGWCGPWCCFFPGAGGKRCCEETVRILFLIFAYGPRRCRAPRAPKGPRGQICEEDCGADLSLASKNVRSSGAPQGTWTLSQTIVSEGPSFRIQQLGLARTPW